MMNPMNKNTTQIPQDYYGEDGLLHCGVCHKRKEIPFPKGSKPGGRACVPIMCDCRAKRDAKAEARHQAIQHKVTVEKLTRQCMTNLASLMNVGFEERNALLRSLGSCDLLILDDFGMERDSRFGLETVFQVIDRRVTARKPLIITTNLSLEQLKHPADLDHKRIYDRVLSVTAPVCFAGGSLREQENQAGLDWMREILG
jgi:hypothetical protein